MTRTQAATCTLGPSCSLNGFAAAAVALALIVFAAPLPVHAAETEVDPLGSVMWPEMREQFFGDAPVVFDSAVKVSVPIVVENQAQVPVTADARSLDDVQKLVVFADLNPIQHVATLKPAKAAAFIALRMKVEQGTPVRAAALTADGTWHVGGVYLDAAGGGCSSPALARNKPDWSATVGNAQGRLWRQADGSARVRLKVRHPMDTGLTLDNTPAFFIETMRLADQKGETLATVKMSAPMSEDPTVTLLVQLPLTDTALAIDSRDTDGNRYSASVPATWKQSSADAHLR